MATKLTKAQANTIRAVLAAGGKIAVRHSNLKRGGVNKFVVARLCDAGLLEHQMATPAQMVARGFWEGAVPMSLGLFATAAGCLALNAYDAAQAARVGVLS